MAKRRDLEHPPTTVEADEIRSLRREAKVAQALREVGVALGAALELEELLFLVLRKSSELVPTSRVSLFVLDEQKRKLIHRADSQEVSSAMEIDLGEGVLSHVARSGRESALSDAQLSGRVREWESVFGATHHSALLVPLKNNLGRSIGVILALGSALEAFSDDDREILSVLAKQAAIAIDNSRLLATLIRKNQQLLHAQEQLTRRVRDLELLFELERSTGSASSFPEMAEAVLPRLAKACSADGAILLLPADGGEAASEFTCYAEPGRDASTRAEPRPLAHRLMRTQDGILGPVVERSAPLQVDVTGVPFDHHGIKVRTWIAEPLSGDTGVLGALGLINKRSGPFTAEDLGLLRLVSANVSTAVHLFQVKREREREERLSSIGRLLSQVVHDLKSPLTVISGYVELMETSVERSARSKYAQEILKQFQALGAMQREVLAFARGETQVFLRKVLLDHFFLELEETLKRELGDRRIRLEFRVERRLVAQLDSERLTRALQNLVRNAMEAIGAGPGVIVVEAMRNGEDLVIRVKDDGPGVPSDIAPRLFESFVTAGKKDGTGLGLAIVRRIAQEHGGEIRLVPAEIGATFEMRLPRVLLLAAGSAEGSRSDRKPRGATSSAEAEPRPAPPKKQPKERVVPAKDKDRRRSRGATFQATTSPAKPPKRRGAK